MILGPKAGRAAFIMAHHKQILRRARGATDPRLKVGCHVCHVGAGDECVTLSGVFKGLTRSTHKQRGGDRRKA